MKTTLGILIACTLTALPGAQRLEAAESKRTADYLLTTPRSNEGKDVSIDVSFVKPVHLVTRLPGIAFFHAATFDRMTNRPGGQILVAVPSDQAEKFARKFGTSPERRGETDQLKGTFLAGGPRGGANVWMIDTTGKLAQLIAERKLNAAEFAMGEGPNRRGLGN